MKRWQKWVVGLVIVAGAAGAGWWAFGPKPVDRAPETVAVGRGRIETTVLASGVLQASSLVSVGAQVSGRIEAVHVTLGQTVAKGDLIAEIDSLDQENAVKSAEAALKGIEAQKRSQQAAVTKADTALARSQQLSAGSLVSQTDLESAEASLAQAEAQLDQLDAQLAQAQLTVESAKLDLSRTQIVAPADGTVVALLVEEGQTVNANSTTPTIAKIANLDTMVIKAEISEADVVKVEPGQRVYFTILGEPDRKIEATLREVEPAPTSISADSTASTTGAIYYNGLFEVPNPDHTLRISMTAEVTIVLDEAENALLLPAGVVTTGPGGARQVMVYDPQTKSTRRQDVEVGLDNNIQVEILSGLDEGALVVNATGSRLAGAGGRGGGFGAGGPPMMMAR